MARPRKVVEKPIEDHVTVTTKVDLLDVIAEVIQHYCGVPGCSAKWHREEAQLIVNKLAARGMLKEVE